MRIFIVVLILSCLCVSGVAFANETNDIENQLVILNLQTVSDNNLAQVQGAGSSLWFQLAKKGLIKIFGPKAWIDRYLKDLNPMGDDKCKVPLLPWFLQPQCAY